MNAWPKTMTISGNSYIYMHSMHIRCMNFIVANLDAKAHVIEGAGA